MFQSNPQPFKPPVTFPHGCAPRSWQSLSAHDKVPTHPSRSVVLTAKRQPLENSQFLPSGCVRMFFKKNCICLFFEYVHIYIYRYRYIDTYISLDIYIYRDIYIYIYDPKKWMLQKEATVQGSFCGKSHPFETPEKQRLRTWFQHSDQPATLPTLALAPVYQRKQRKTHQSIHKKTKNHATKTPR